MKSTSSNNDSNINNNEESEFIYGRHAVIEMLKSEDAAQRVNKIFLQTSVHGDQVTKILDLAKRKNLVVQESPKTKLDKLTDNGNHQGVVASITPYKYSTMEDAFNLAKERDESLFMLMLDGIEDPHNLGSILRTADAVGVHGVIIPKRRATGLTSTVAKTAAGALEHVPVIRVTNLVDTIKQLKKQNIWFFGTDMDGKDYRQWNAKGDVVLVIGNEGKGISTLVKKQMDETLSIPMVGHVQSLNAGVAAGVLMYQGFYSKRS